jgi:D-3-phosphoglycerate dehydrogenase
VTTVEGVVVFDRSRLTQVDGITCEASLEGHLLFFKNEDVPGVIGWIGSVLGQNHINIANFSLGRQDTPPKSLEVRQALAIVETDGLVPEAVLRQLLENKAVKIARVVEFKT